MLNMSNHLCRFSGDMHVVDVTLPHAMSSFLFTIIEVLAVMCVIAASFPIFTAVVFPVAALYFFMIRIYIPTSRYKN